MKARSKSVASKELRRLAVKRALAWAFALAGLASLNILAGDKPNLVYILADDLGYGDVHCLNPERGKIKTPQLDRLAAQGMSFTDAHSSSAVCTPTRYGILIFDGGHRIPFIARWPGKIKAGAKSDQLICLTDLMATYADLLGVKLPSRTGEDSVSILPALLGKTDKPLREAVVYHSINGSFAIRQGPWKLELCADSGGWSAPRPGSKEAHAMPPVQLYNMTGDVSERVNEYRTRPEVVERLTKLLERYIADGRSTAGPPQANDSRIVIRKKSRDAAKATE
jgi:arylsulfatase A-like enzyme